MNENKAVWYIWLNPKERIASFHYETGYKRRRFADFNQLQNYAQALQNGGYRFQ